MEYLLIFVYSQYITEAGFRQWFRHIYKKGIDGSGRAWYKYNKRFILLSVFFVS